MLLSRTVPFPETFGKVYARIGALSTANCCLFDRGYVADQLADRCAHLAAVHWRWILCELGQMPAKEWRELLELHEGAFNSDRINHRFTGESDPTIM
jgi:hypothetical protein